MYGEKFCEKVVDYVLRCSLEQLKDLTIENVAAHFGTTKMTLTTKFKTQKNMTPGKFITREKMYRSLVIVLLHTELDNQPKNYV
jgi:AraC-like DNA-binding protein